MANDFKRPFTPRDTLSENDKSRRAGMKRAARPFLASTIVILRTHNNQMQILMGQRSVRHDFMPSIYVFPGGRVDRVDSFAPSIDAIDPRTARILESQLPKARARAAVLAAIRETFEETGLVLGKKGTPSRNVNNASWDGFHQSGHVASLDGIHVFGRAITPPYRPKRFDTWFFYTHIDKECDTTTLTDTAELLNVGWFTFDDALNLKLHDITKAMLRELRERLKADTHPNHIVFSRFEHGKFNLSPLSPQTHAPSPKRI